MIRGWFQLPKRRHRRNSDVSWVVGLIASPLLPRGFHVHLHLCGVTWGHTWVQRRFSVLRLHSYFISHLHRLLVDVIDVVWMLVINFVVSVGSLIIVVWVRDFIFAVEFRVFVDILGIGFIVCTTVSWMTETEKNYWMFPPKWWFRLKDENFVKQNWKILKIDPWKTNNFKKIIEHKSLLLLEANYNFLWSKF